MIISQLTMIFLSLLNLFFFVYVIYIEQFYLLYLLFIVVSYILYRRIYIKYLVDYEGLPVLLYLFLPGLGGIIVSTSLFLLYYIKRGSLMIEDYESYIRFQNSHMNPKNFDYESTVRTMSALAAMSYYGDKLKKELIVNNESGLIKESIDLLRLGNLDEDSEVQHYAAVTLNTLENSVNNEIRLLKDKLKESNNRQILDRLLELYKAYINSSLLDLDTIKLYNNEYIELLEKRGKLIGITYEYAVDLFNGYLRQMSLKKASDYYELMKIKFGETPEMLLLKMKADLQLENIVEIKSNKKKFEKIYNERQESLTNKQRSQIAFWIGAFEKEEIS